MKIKPRLFLLAILLFLTSIHLSPDSAFAATFIVNSTSDGVDANPGDGICATVGGFCTLRAAIMEANALAGADTITLPAGVYTLTIAGADEDASATGDLDITEDISINGGGSATTIIDGNNLDRVFDIHNGVVTISGITIRGGNPGAGRPGGGIMVSTTIAGPLTILNSTITENRAANGGGIYNPGLGLTLTTSTVDNNVADVDGGGVTNFGFLTMQNSTISNNRANSEAGLSHTGTNALSIVNSTVSGNIASPGAGGGLVINTFAASTIVNTTIVSNTAEFGGGGIVISGIGPVTLRNTIIANNIGGNCNSPITSAGHNLDSGNTCGLNALVWCV
jgi:CSLREA domain-containing protein